MPTQHIVTGTVTIDSAGNGTLRFGPSKYGERWIISRLTTNGNTASGLLTIYRGPIGSQMLDLSKYPNKDISETTLDLKSGETITVHYTTCTPGALMTFYVEGEIKYGI